MREYYVYILASQRNGTLYIGVTSDLESRMLQHQAGTFAGFTKKYRVYSLVYFETSDSIEAAIAREKQLKHWNREWKLNLINHSNPNWTDLFGSSPARG